MDPTVYCLASGTTTGCCPVSALVAYVPDPDGFVTIPCGGVANTVPHVNAMVMGQCLCLNSASTLFSSND